MSVPQKRSSRVLGVLGVAAAVGLPFVLWHDLISSLGGAFRLDPVYLLFSWGGFALMALGVLAIVPVALSAGGGTTRRFHPRRRERLAGWGMSLYLLGLAMVVQLAAVATIP